jgi:hypothetical protein
MVNESLRELRIILMLAYVRIGPGRGRFAARAARQRRETVTSLRKNYANEPKRTFDRPSVCATS